MLCRQSVNQSYVRGGPSTGTRYFLEQRVCKRGASSDRLGPICWGSGSLPDYLCAQWQQPGRVDRAVASLEIQELPSARGCTYVVPRDDFAVALLAGKEFGGAEMKTATKLGVKEAEIDKLCSAVLKALESEPLEPEEIRKGVGGAVRNLGEEGKKKGLTTTLPVALGMLQTMGEIRRVPTNGRLDQQRYRYTLWRPNPLAGVKTSGAEINTELARRFFQWIGPASIAEFRWFSGLGAKVCDEAIKPLKLVKVYVGTGSEERWMFAEDLEALNSFTEPKTPHYVLVSGLDGIAHLRRDMRSLLAPMI